MADITLRILGQEPLPLNLGSDNSETLSVGSGVTEGRLQEVLTDYVPKSDIDDTLSISGDVAEAKATGDAIRDIESKLADILPSDSASGAIASFPDGAKDFPLKSLEVDIEPKQDLHGQASPYPGGAGKNLFNKDAVEMNKWIDVNATTVSTSNGYAVSDYIPVTQGQVYYLGAKGSSRSAYYDENKNGIAYVAYNGGSAFTAQHTGYMRFTLFAADMTALLNSLQFEKGSSATSYAPYSNICPITGYDSVNVVRTGKNLLSGKFESGSAAGVTRTVHNDGSVTFSGTTTNVSAYRSANIDVTEGDVLHLSGCPSGGGSNTLRLDVRDSNGALLSGQYYDTGNGVTFTVPSGTSQIQIGIRFGNGVVTDDVVMKPVLCLESTRGTYTIPLPSTVYGGTIKDGVLTVDMVYAKKALSTRTYVNHLVGYDQYGWGDFFGVNVAGGSNNAGISNIAPYNFNTSLNTHFYSNNNTSGLVLFVPSDTSASTEIEAVMKLATPQTISLTPTEIKTLLGDNNIFADSGDTSVVYSADIAKYIEKKLA